MILAEFSNDAQNSILFNIYLYSGKEKCVRETEGSASVSSFR